MPELGTKEGAAKVLFNYAYSPPSSSLLPSEIPSGPVQNRGEVDPLLKELQQQNFLFNHGRVWARKTISIPFGMSAFFIGMLLTGFFKNDKSEANASAGCIFMLLLLSPFLFFAMHGRSGNPWWMDLLGSLFGAWFYLWSAARLQMLIKAKHSGLFATVGLGILSLLLLRYAWRPF